MKFKLFKVRPFAMKILMSGILLFLVLQILAQFTSINLSTSPIFYPTLVGLFLLADQGVIDMKRGVSKPKSFLGWTLTVFGGLMLLGVVIGSLSITASAAMLTLLKWVNILTAVALAISLTTE